MTGYTYRYRFGAAMASFVLLLLACPNLLGRSRIIFQDNFSPRLAQGWTWVREEPSAWRIANGALSIHTLSGTLWGATNNVKNLLLRPAPTNRNNWAVEVTVSSHPGLDGEQAGLLYYVDDDNYIKLVKEWKKAQPYAILVREQAHKPKVIGKLPVYTRSVTLQLSMENGHIQGKMGENGTQSLKSIGECAPLQGSDIRVGLLTHVWPGKTDRWAKFTKFQISNIQ